jgi:hypothetical protein
LFAAAAAAAASAAAFSASSAMVMKSRKPDGGDEDGEQSRRDAPQKPYRLSPDAGSERRGSGGLLSWTAVHAVDGME